MHQVPKNQAMVLSLQSLGATARPRCPFKMSSPLWVKSLGEVLSNNSLFQEYPQKNFCTNIWKYKNIILKQRKLISFECQHQNNIIYFSLVDWVQTIMAIHVFTIMQRSCLSCMLQQGKLQGGSQTS